MSNKLSQENPTREDFLQDTAQKSIKAMQKVIWKSGVTEEEGIAILKSIVTGLLASLNHHD